MSSSAAFLKRFKAKQKELQAGAAATPAAAPEAASDATTAGAVGDPASDTRTAAAAVYHQARVLEVNMDDVVDERGFLRDDADVDEDVAQAIQEAAAEANDRRLRRRRMGMPASGDGGEGDISGTIRLQVDAAGNVKRKASGLTRRTLLSDGFVNATAQPRLQSEFATSASADAAKRPREAAQETAASASRHPVMNPADRAEALARRAELVRLKRTQMAEAQKTAARTAKAAAEGAAGAANGFVSSETFVELDSAAEEGGTAGAGPEDLLQVLPSVPKPAEASPVADAGTWSKAELSAPVAPNARVPDGTAVAPPGNDQAASAHAAGTAASAAAATAEAPSEASAGKKKKKINALAIAKKLVSEKRTEQSVAAASDGAAGRQDAGGRLLSSSDAFKQLSREFDDARRR